MSTTFKVTTYWEYEEVYEYTVVDPLPEGWEDMAPIQQFTWLEAGPIDGHLINSVPLNFMDVESVEQVDSKSEEF